MSSQGIPNNLWTKQNKVRLVLCLLLADDGVVKDKKDMGLFEMNFFKIQDVVLVKVYSCLGPYGFDIGGSSGRGINLVSLNAYV